MNLPHRSRCRPGSCGVRRCHRRQGCRAFPAGSCRPFSAARCSPPNLCAALRCGAAHNRPLQWYFSCKTSSFFISIQEISSDRGGNISCFEIIIRAIPHNSRLMAQAPLRRLRYCPIKCASKMARRFCHFCAIQQKQPMTSFVMGLWRKERDSNP